MPVERLMLLQRGVVPTTFAIGVSNESFSQAITHDLALSVSHCLGSEVPISDSERASWRRSLPVHPGIRGADEQRGGGAQCADRPRSSTEPSSLSVLG